MSLGNVKLNPIGEASVEILPDARKRVTRRWEVISDFLSPDQITAQVFQDYGTPDGKFGSDFTGATIAGRPDKHYPTCLLINQSMGSVKDQQGKGVLTKVYEEIPATATEIEPPKGEDIPGAFKNFTTTGSITLGSTSLTSVADTTGLAVGNNISVAGAGAVLGNCSIGNGFPGLTVPPGLGPTFIIGSTITVAGAGAAGGTLTASVLSVAFDVVTLSANASTTVLNAIVRGNTLFSTITAIAGSTVTLADAAGKASSGAAVTGLSSLPAREYTSRLIVTGDGSTAGIRLPENTPYYTSVPAGKFQRYLTDQRIEPNGSVFCFLTRIYTELPDPYSYGDDIVYSFPGKMGGTYTSPVFQEPTTAWTRATITERYALEAPFTSSIDFNAINWVTQVEGFKPDSTGILQFYQTSKPNWLDGGYHLNATSAAYDRNGVLGTNYSIQIGSNPSYPINGFLARTVRSVPQPNWRGKMMKIIDTKVIFAP